MVPGPQDSKTDSQDDPRASARLIELNLEGKGDCHARSVEVWVPQRLEGDEAVVVWDAALVLAYFLERHQRDFLSFSSVKPTIPLSDTEEERVHVVDVGAGTGAVGLSAAALGARATLTDLERILPLLEEGIRLNPDLKGTLLTRPLPWGQPLPSGVLSDADLICVSDCVYYEASLAPLIFTLRELAKPKKAPILLSYENRDYSPEKKRIKESFFSIAEEHFNVTTYSPEDCHPTYSSEDISVLRLDLKECTES